MIKRIVAVMSALALAVGLLPTVLADEVTSTKPEITVVAKRITGEDNYMEISLEVNGDYEDYSSVGAVLQYDPSLIVPTTWDDEATAVDMSESTTWATRRALPTLGKDTWTTHTALTYIESKTDTATNQTTKTGYLYLGAEYPGVVPNNTTDPSATADPDATPTPTKTPTVTPTPDPKATPDPDQHQNPVVVARFTYADENAKKKIEDQWTSAWDSDWTQNKVLTIASDDVSSVSPAQFGFMIYKADFSMKGYQYDYTDSVLETSEQAANKDIEIVLGQGKSEKSGGLSLNDIYVTMFYDWDDSLIGTLTCGVGEDATESVNDYVKEDAIYYAKWIPNTYTLKLEVNGKVTEVKGSFNSLKKLEIPESNYKITYDEREVFIKKSFKGWVNENNETAIENYIFKKDEKLKAIFEDTVNVQLEDINKENNICSWNTKKSGNGESYDAKTTININSDIKLYSVCKQIIKPERPINSGTITSYYGNRIHPVSNENKFHSGIDMVSSDKNIYPVLPGVIAKTGSNSSMGNYIIIHHTYNNQNYTTAYYHLEEKYVRKNQKVDQNTVIGKMGQTGIATGVHLHLTMYKGHLDSENSEMIDPKSVIDLPSNWNSRVY